MDGQPYIRVPHAVALSRIVDHNHYHYHWHAYDDHRRSDDVDNERRSDDVDHERRSDVDHGGSDVNNG
jgi:hypothetical protein